MHSYAHSRLEYRMQGSYRHSAMAESDPSLHSGSDADLGSDGGGLSGGIVEGSPTKRSNSKGHKRLGSVRALAIKKVQSPTLLSDKACIFFCLFVCLSFVCTMQGLLTHEVDEGSPCLRCGDNCPGFSLHFWRQDYKIVLVLCSIFCKIFKNPTALQEGVQELSVSAGRA